MESLWENQNWMLKEKEGIRSERQQERSPKRKRSKRNERSDTLFEAVSDLTKCVFCQVKKVVLIIEGHVITIDVPCPACFTPRKRHPSYKKRFPKEHYSFVRM